MNRSRTSERPNVHPRRESGLRFWGGSAGGASSESDKASEGIGGGISVRPLGVLEIRDDTTGFIPFGGGKKLLGALFLGLLLGAWLAGRPRKS